MVVDEDAACAQQCAAILRGEGYELRTAEGAQEALACLRRKMADLVIVSLSLPRSEGIQLLAQVKELYPDTDVVVMVSSTRIEDALEAMRRGASDFLPKPFEPVDLKRVTTTCLTALRAAQGTALLKQSNAIFELNQLLAANTDIHALPVRALELARQNFEGDAALLLAFDASHNSLSVSAHSGASLARWGLSEQLSAQGLEAIRQGRVIVSAEAGNGDCYAYAPLLTGGCPMGVLCLRRAGGPWFHEKTTELLQVFATHLALALESVRLHDTAARQVADLEEMIAGTRFLASCTDGERMCSQLLQSATRAIGAELCAVLLVEGSARRLRTSPTVPEGTALHEAIRGRLLAVLDPAAPGAMGTHRHSADVRRRLSSFISAPLVASGRTFGVLGVFSAQENAFGVEDAGRLSLLAQSAAAARENSSRLLRVTLLYNETIELLGATVDSRCPQNAGHSSQVRAFAGALAKAAGLTETEIYRIEDGALLHDIGKIRVPDSLITKAGPLTAEEFAIVAAHPAYGAEMLAQAPHLRDLAPIVRHHHERFDGAGYPDGLRGEAIPIGARIVALADVFDALVSTRIYRDATPATEARCVIQEGAGSQFDPELVKLFLTLPLEQLIEH